MTEWLDMSVFPDLDPDTAVSPQDLAALRDGIGAPVPQLPEEDWAHLLDVAFDPGEDIVDVAADGFDDPGYEDVPDVEDGSDGAYDGTEHDDEDLW
ncbi:hypothetical protein KZZ52_39875 [Dactylosporangium sp. AC04546]|uniref:hypothetical protein n=1 Tax=Dactylosporangium sp. AC04546 TaxID=2862460 RepID=UPI001EDF7001|nr:hypothetical protein [Dactylosporangium sp. AC04546]WVK80109.1 hypothetical protein KZZ52_39875 [Dactylosporangium sp. AC04546]